METKNFRYSVYFFLALALPGAGLFFPQLSNQLIWGVEKEQHDVPLSLETLWEGSYQAQFSDWFSKSFFLRDMAVLSYNQLYLWLFGELSSDTIVLGKQNHLYHTEYLNELSENALLPQSVLKEFAEQLEKTHHALKERGVEFLVLISASKARVYPEFLPAQFEVTSVKETENSSAKLTAYLKDSGVNFLHTGEQLKQMKSLTSYPVYPKGGIHWSYSASCEITARLYEKILSLLGQAPFALKCQAGEESLRPNMQDSDIALTSNVWFKSRFFDSHYLYPALKRKVKATDKEQKPRIGIVGSSFSFNLIYYALSAELFEELELLYYFRRLDTYQDEIKANYNYEPSEMTAIASESFNWEEKVFSKDLIVLEMNEANIRSLGYGFPKALIEYLEEAKGDS